MFGVKSSIVDAIIGKITGNPLLDIALISFCLYVFIIASFDFEEQKNAENTPLLTHLVIWLLLFIFMTAVHLLSQLLELFDIF